MPARRLNPTEEIARLQQMLDYVLQHVRAREHSLDDPHALVLFERTRKAIRDLQDEVVHYLPHAAQRGRVGTHH